MWILESSWLWQCFGPFKFVSLHSLWSNKVFCSTLFSNRVTVLVSLWSNLCKVLGQPLRCKTCWSSLHLNFYRHNLKHQGADSCIRFWESAWVCKVCNLSTFCRFLVLINANSCRPFSTFCRLLQTFWRFAYLFDWETFIHILCRLLSKWLSLCIIYAYEFCAFADYLQTLCI